MSEATIDRILVGEHEAILAAVQARMRGEGDMDRVAAQRALAESDLAAQVTNFWLQAIRTDLALGSTGAMAQNLRWLVSLRAGHGLLFDDALVMRTFDVISAEIDARLPSSAAHAEYAAYRARVAGLISGAFPGQGGEPG